MYCARFSQASIIEFYNYRDCCLPYLSTFIIYSNLFIFKQKSLNCRNRPQPAPFNKIKFTQRKMPHCLTTKNKSSLHCNGAASTLYRSYFIYSPFPYTLLDNSLPSVFISSLHHPFHFFSNISLTPPSTSIISLHYTRLLGVHLSG